MLLSSSFCFFFFNDTATTEIYTLSLHDALPIFIIVVAVGFLGESLAHREPIFTQITAGGEDAAQTTTPTEHKRKSRSEEHTSELQSQSNLVCRLLLEKKKKTRPKHEIQTRHGDF